MSKKVAYFIDTFFEINGVARTSQALLERSNEEGRNFKFITTYSDGYDTSKVYNFKPFISIPLPYYPELRINICSYFAILKFCRQEDFDIIYAPTPGVLGLYAIFISKALKKPLVSAFHTDFASYVHKYTKIALAARISRWFLRQTYNRSKRVLCPSNVYKDILIESGVKEELIKVFTRGANKEKFNSNFKDESFWANYIADYKGESIVLYVGRVSEEKKVSLFVEVSEVFRDSNAKFVMVGDGPARKKIEPKASNVIFTGYFTGETLSKAYASSDIFLFPSETETFGNVVLEACSSGICPIVSDKGACKEHIQNGVNGYIASNFDEYVKTVEELLKNPKLLSTNKANALKSVENIDAQNLLSVMLDLIELK